MAEYTLYQIQNKVRRYKFTELLKLLFLIIFHPRTLTHRIHEFFFNWCLGRNICSLHSDNFPFQTVDAERTLHKFMLN